MIYKNLLVKHGPLLTISLFSLLFGVLIISCNITHKQNLQEEEEVLLHQPRILEEYPLAPFLVAIAPYIQWSLILTIIAMVSNSFSLLFPIILYLQTFFYMGFVTVEQGPLKQFYSELLNSRITLFGVLKAMFGIDTSFRDNGLPANYRFAGVQMKLVHNIIPVFMIIGVLLFVTIAVVLLNLILKSQKMRKFTITIKSIWNGSVYCLMPNICFAMGAKGFFLNFQTTQNIIDTVVFGVLGILIFVYFGLTIVQIKKHVSHPSIKQFKKSISYINNLKSSLFKFDCLVYSIRYYYAQTYFKTIIYYVGVGITFGYPKIGVGILLFGQLLQFIIFVTNPPFIKLRHNIISGFSYLSTMIHCFCLLIIDLNVVVQNHRAAIIFIYIYLALHFLVVILLLINIMIDIGTAINAMIKKKNVFDKKNSVINSDLSQTNVKLDQTDKMSQQTKPKSREKLRDRSKKRRKDKQSKKGSKNRLIDTKSQIQQQKQKLKFSVMDQKQNQIMNNPPKIRKIKRPRQL